MTYVFIKFSRRLNSHISLYRSLGKVGKIVGTTIGLYVFTTICAAMIGVLVSVIFSQFYHIENDGHAEIVPADVRLGCTVNKNDEIDSYLTKQADGSIMCMSIEADMNSTLFRLEDENGYFQTAIPQATKLSLSSEVRFVLIEGYSCVHILFIAKLFTNKTASNIHTQSIYQGLFLQLIDDNMIGMFYRTNFLGVIILGAGFGVALNTLSTKSELQPQMHCVDPPFMFF